MWVNSKAAAEILGVNLRKLQRSVINAQNNNQKNLTINTKYFSYSYIDGVGRGGKVLQIWIDDSLIEAKKDEICQKNQEFLTYIDGSVKKSSEIQPVDVSVLDSESVKAKNKITESVDSFNYTMEDRNGHNRNNYSGSLHGHNVSLGSIDCDRNSNNSRRYARVYRETKEIGINANYTAINRGELKNGSIGLDHSGNLAAGRKNKNLDGVVNRDLRHYSRSNDNKAILSRKTLDKSEVLAHVKLYGVKAAELEYGIPAKTIYRWQKEFAQKGGKALEDKRGRVSKANVKMIKDAILSIGTAQKTSWWMEYCRRYALSKELNFDMFAPLKADIGRSTFLRHASKIASEDYDVRTFLRAGRDGLNTNISIKRDYLKANEEWQVDATPYDFMCLDENGEPVRYTAVGIIDVGGEMRVYDLCDSPNGYANVRLLKKALKEMGRPGYIKGDHGKDYVGKHFQGVLKRLGVQYVKAPKFTGNAKGKIERCHKEMQDFFECLPGFLAHNVGDRAIREKQAEDKAAMLSGAKTNIKNLMTRDQMQTMINRWCESFKGSEEVEEFSFDERVFGNSKERTLQAEGFSINGFKFTSLEVFRHAKIGDKLETIENVDDASIYHVYKDGEYICDVMNQDVAKMSAEEVKAAQKEYEKRVIRPTKAYIRSLQNEKDEYYKADAERRLKEVRKSKSEILKKPSDKLVSKIEQEAVIANNIVYLPDPDDAFESLN